MSGISRFGGEPGPASGGLVPSHNEQQARPGLGQRSFVPVLAIVGVGLGAGTLFLLLFAAVTALILTLVVMIAAFAMVRWLVRRAAGRDVAETAQARLICEAETARQPAEMRARASGGNDH